ncbi:MAG TPA: HDIG domain-containing protein [Thermoanaerobaculia bacterium]|nr:HDIG domain-containing protein [Thermoanaerobaculia bacterium]
MSSPAPKRPSRIDLLQTGTFVLRRRLQEKRPWQRALETPALWVVLFLLVGTWTLMPGGFLFSPRAAAGAIAARDYVASRDLLVFDEEATRTKQQTARDAVLPVYDLDLNALEDLDGRLEQIFSRGRRMLAPDTPAEDGSTPTPQPTARQLLKEFGPEQLRMSDDQAELLVRKGFSAPLEERLRSVAARALRRGVVSNKAALLENRMRGITLRRFSAGEEVSEEIHFDLFDHLGYPGEAREFIDAEVGDWSGYTSRERTLLADLLFDNLPINLLPNRSETLDRIETAAAGAGRVFNQIRKGQVIVRKGDVVDAADARVIAQMRGERQLRMQVPPLAGTFFLLSLAVSVVWLALSQEKVADHGPRRVFGESLLLLLGSLLMAKFCFLVAGALSGAFEAEPLNSARSYMYAIPFASLALLAALLLGRYSALVLSILLSILASRMAIDGDGQWVIFYGFAGSLAAIYALDRYQFRQRLVMVRVGLVVGVINVLMVLILTSLAPMERGWMQIGFDVFCAFIGGLLVTASASFAVPILESMLAITTDIKLVELSNTNLPLLRRLAFEAPGTFQHSLMVANLAKEGCEAIGADPVLAYASGLYHDVGKVLRPEYFVENQRGGQNRHDKLLPSMSALILLNHVKDGLELAREHGLPQVIHDAISQHHGTRLIKYFYHRAMEQKDSEVAEVTEDKYRYPGPRPQNKVMGVLMLADAVEAASRTLTEPTPAKIRGLIQTILDDILKDGQLEQTDLTLSDLRTVSDTFVRVLANIFHQRIDYPGFDFNRRTEKRAPDIGEAGAAARAS